MPAAERVRAACYCRISSDPKDRREGVDRQREDTMALCEMKGWQVAGVYVDNDRSASKGTARPEWDRLLADIAAGKIDAVAAWDQDRVNRMMDDFVAYKKLFVQRGVLLATSNNGDIDLSTPSGVLTATIKTAVSEHEVAMMRVRMRRAARQKAEQGVPKWRRAFGYLESPDGPTPDPVTAPLVKQAYAAVISGGSISDVARAWNTAGAHGLKGQPWTASTVSLFLRKPRNAGLREHNGTVVGKGTWPGLVDDETWQAAQSVLNAPGRAPGRKTVRRHPLTGVLRCGKPGCGHYLSGMQTLDKSIVYRCKKCLGVSVRAVNVEPLIFGVVAGRLARPDAVDLLRAKQHDAAEAEAVRAEKQALYAQIRDAEAEYDDGVIDGRRLQARRDRVNEKLAAIDHREQDQERLRVFDGLPLGTPEVAEKMRALSQDRFRAVIDVLVEFVVTPVGKGRHVFNPERVQVNWR
jgi:DNA invertase Pin-like site-specific DNA recombinase